MTRSTSHFSADILRALDQMDEVQIEPRSTAGQQVTIWVVVADNSEVYVRSVRGARGRWYRALVEQPEGKLVAGRREIPFRSILVDDAQSIAQASEAFQRKYERKWPRDTASMLVEEVLPTTLRLDPT